MATNKKTPELSRDLTELLHLLVRHNVEFMIVGDHAVSFHGYPRFTKYVDVWLEATEENAVKVVAALREFGFDVPGLNVDSFHDPLKVVRIGTPPNQVDFLAQLVECDFSDCRSRAQRATIAGVAIPFIGKDDLIRNKTATGRPRDLGDVDELIKRS
jgi:predicted nucleotidyltransferase